MLTRHRRTLILHFPVYFSHPLLTAALLWPLYCITVATCKRFVTERNELVYALPHQNICLTTFGQHQLEIKCQFG